MRKAEILAVSGRPSSAKYHAKRTWAEAGGHHCILLQHDGKVLAAPATVMVIQAPEGDVETAGPWDSCVHEGIISFVFENGVGA